MITIKINNVQVDSYADETIEVTSKMKDSMEIASVYTDYSTDFVLPASRTNNKIFKHWQDEEVQDSVFLNRMVDCSLEIDNTPFKRGKLKLNSVVTSGGVPQEYNVTFYGDGINFRSLMGDAKLEDLDFSDIPLTRLATEVRTGLIGGSNALYSGKVIYPLIQKGSPKWTAATLADGSTVSPTDLFPALQVRYILSKLEALYRFQFDSEYLDSTQFGKLYMWCPKEPNEATGDSDTSTVVVDFQSNSGSSYGVSLDADDVNLLLYKLGTYNISIVGNFTTATSKDYTIITEVVRNGGSSYEEYSREVVSGTSKTVSMTVSNSINADIDKIKYKVEADSQFTFYFTGSGAFSNSSTSNSSWQINTFGESQSTIDPATDFKALVPTMTQIEFLQAIIKLGNLVIEPKGNDTFYIEPYQVWKARRKVVDLTKYMYANDTVVESYPLPSSFSFKYQEPKEAIGKYFLDYKGYAYGDKVNIDTGATGSPYNVESPFTNLMWERLSASNIQMATAAETNDDNGDLKPISDRAYIFYYGEDITATIDLAGFSSAISSYKGCGSFYPISAPIYTVNYGREVNPYSSSKTSVGVYHSYWEDFIVAKFQNKRIYKFKANIPMAVLSTPYIDGLDNDGATPLEEPTESIRLCDIIKINGRYYDIEEYSVNLQTGESKFVLSNFLSDETFDDGADNLAPTAPVLYVSGNPDATPPTMGTLSSPTNIDYYGCTLSWTAASDTEGSITNYKVYVDSSEYKIVGNVLTTTITGLSAGTSYSITVTAVDDSGNESSASNSVNLTTTSLPAAPVITSASTASFTEGVGGTYQITATNSPTSYAADGLFVGTWIDSSTGVITISNCPTCGMAGVHNLTVKATNAGGTGTQALTITIT